MSLTKRVGVCCLGAVAVVAMLLASEYLFSALEATGLIPHGAGLVGRLLLDVGLCFGPIYWLVSSRQRAEAARQESEKNAIRASECFALVACGVVDGIWDWNCQTHEVYVSDRWQELVGFKPGELKLDVETWRLMLHPDDRPRVTVAIKAHLEQRKPFEMEYRLQTKSGEYRWFRVQGQAKWDAQGKPVRMAGSLTDIMASRAMGEELLRKTERLQAATESGGVGIWDWDIQTDTLYWDDQMFRLYGREPKLFTSGYRDWAEAVHPDDVAWVVRAVDAALNGEDVLDIVFRIVHPTQKIVHLRARGTVRKNDQGKAVRMVGTNWDITDKVVAEAALRSSEEFVHKIIDLNPALIFVKDRDGRFTLCNQATADFNLCKIEDLIGRTDAELSSHPEEVQGMRRDDLDVIESGCDKIISEEKVTNARGEARWLQTIKRPISSPDGAGRHVLGIATDITLLKLLELRRAAQLDVTRALADANTLEEASRGILRSVGENLKWDFGSVWRVQGPAKPLQCVAIWLENDPPLADFREATLAGHFLLNIGLPGKIWATSEPLWIPDLASRAEFPRAEAARRSGLHASFGFPIVVRGTVLGVIEFFSRAVREPDQATLEMFTSVGVQIGQFMERRRSELNLAASEAVLRQFIKYTPASIAMLDKDMRYIQASDRWIKDYHLADVDVLGKSHYEVFPDIPQRWRDIHARVLQGAVERCDEDPFPREDGRIDWLQWECRPWHKADGEIGGLIFFTQVITERKRAQEEMKQAVTELERSNRELEQFAYVASHDLQEPLRAVAACVQILARRYSDALDSRAHELIRHSVEGAQRMQNLIHDLLSLSRVNSQGRPLEWVESGPVLDQCLKTMATTINDSSAQVASGDLPSVWADSGQLSQLFQNLVGNAIKYRSERPVEIVVKAVREGAFWHFSVADNGIGIESQHYERIFGVFQRLHTREEYPGTGIGLAICKKIVERHGGTIWVTSVFGEGSVFHFTLPATSPRSRI